MKRRILCVIASLLAFASPAHSSVFFSEYVEGTSNNKALEIYNNTGAVLDFSVGDTYSVLFFSNGNGAFASNTFPLLGLVAPGDVHVVVPSNAGPALLALADQVIPNINFFNGNDAIVLRQNTTHIDVIGQIGVDPGVSWSDGGVDTMDNTLRRKAHILMGDANGNDVFLPSVEWTSHPTDDFTNLGLHSIAAIPEPETYALMLAGLGLLGFVARRRRAAA